jgi:hypothetical protein
MKHPAASGRGIQKNKINVPPVCNYLCHGPKFLLSCDIPIRKANRFGCLQNFFRLKIGEIGTIF